jgi:hypothetical protein
VKSLEPQRIDERAGDQRFRQVDELRGEEQGDREGELSEAVRCSPLRFFAIDGTRTV